MTAMSTPKPKDYLETGEAAALLFVSPRTVARWAEEGKIPCTRTLGRHRRFAVADIRVLAAKLAEPVQEAS
jgi:excisionase family DNA binding protein